MKIKAIILGVTGMVGEGVLHECLNHPDVETVLVVNRKPCGIVHPKLKEIIHADFLGFSSLGSELAGYNACFFCMGISSVGRNRDEYRTITYDLTIHVAETVLGFNPGMAFCYVSGAGTDSTEKGRIEWARVKGKTENDLLKMTFGSAYMFRPGLIRPTKGLKNSYKIYRLMAPLFPALVKLFPKYVCSLRDVGQAMINCVLSGYKKPVLENRDIREFGKVLQLHT